MLCVCHNTFSVLCFVVPVRSVVFIFNGFMFFNRTCSCYACMIKVFFFWIGGGGNSLFFVCVCCVACFSKLGGASGRPGAV